MVASWGGGAVDGGSVNAFLAVALTRVMRTVVPIPTVASASVVHSGVTRLGPDGVFLYFDLALSSHCGFNGFF